MYLAGGGGGGFNGSKLHEDPSRKVSPRAKHESLRAKFTARFSLDEEDWKSHGLAQHERDARDALSTPGSSIAAGDYHGRLFPPPHPPTPPPPPCGTYY